MKVYKAELVIKNGVEFYEYRLTSDHDSTGQRVGGQIYLNTPPVAEMTIRIDEPMFQVGQEVPITSPKPDARKNLLKWFGDPYEIARTLTTRITEFRKELKAAGYEWDALDIESFLSEVDDA